MVDFAIANDMAISNTFFGRSVNQYITYKSGVWESQRNFAMCRRNYLKEVRNCKDIKEELVTTHHRLVVLDSEIKGVRRGMIQGKQKK